MNEYVLPGEHSLTQSLKLLHKLFLVLSSLDDSRHKKFLRDFVKQASRSPDRAWTYLCKEAQIFNDEEFDLADPVLLFDTFKLPAYVGEKSQGVMFCKDMVIGLKLSLGKDKFISYRLDYDPAKKLHINLDVYNGQERFPICIPLRFSTGRFGFSYADMESCQDDDGKKDALLELTKYKFWLKMTMAHTLAGMGVDIVNTKNKMSIKKQLFNFLRGAGEYSFDTVKACIVNILVSAKGKKAINQCEDEKTLLSCIMDKPRIRAQVRHCLFEDIARNHSGGAALTGVHHNSGVEVGDSDTRIDSEKPPRTMAP